MNESIIYFLRFNETHTHTIKMNFKNLNNFLLT